MNLACSGDKSFPDRCVSSTDLREASEERPLKVCGKRGTLEESEPRALGFSNTAICVIMRTSILSRLGRFAVNSRNSLYYRVLIVRLLTDIRDILVRCRGSGHSRKISEISIVDMQNYMLIGWEIRIVMYRIIRVVGCRCRGCLLSR